MQSAEVALYLSNHWTYTPPVLLRSHKSHSTLKVSNTLGSPSTGVWGTPIHGHLHMSLRLLIAVQSPACACRKSDYTHFVSNCDCTFSRSMCSLLTTHQAAHAVQPPCQWPDTLSLLTAAMLCTYLASVHMFSRCLQLSATMQEAN